MTFSIETLVIAGFVFLVLSVSAIRSSIKHEGFFGSLFWTLKKIALIIYCIFVFVGTLFVGILRGLTDSTKRTHIKKRAFVFMPKVFMSERSLHEAVARHLESTCRVRAHVNEPIPGLKGVRKLRRPDVWAQGNHRWYVCEVKDSKGGWTADLDRAPFQLGTVRTAIEERFGGSVSCFIGITERLYDKLSDGKLAQIHDEVRDRGLGVLIIERSGRCRVECDYRRRD